MTHYRKAWGHTPRGRLLLAIAKARWRFNQPTRSIRVRFKRLWRLMRLEKRLEAT